ncbi:hypothetical protein RB195_015763 [Necator americanus]|uniref:SCP domain-containing protein n=1 Tax=Necator americanus TaxID=51031 RepID=A0ABR1E6C7_NECAM
MNTLLLTLFLASLQLYNNAVASAAGFKCHNSLISDQWRSVILDLINGFRRTVAKGEQEGKDGVTLPTAVSMNQLEWDCNIEAEAQDAAKTCPDTISPLPAFQTKGYTLGHIILKGTIKANNCDATKTAKDLLTELWATAAAKQTNQAAERSNNEFAQLAHNKVSAFACTYQICQATSYYLLCFFNQKAPTNGDVYTADAKGKYCSDEAACPTCVDGLCERTPEPGWTKSGESYAKPATKMIELQYDKTLEDAAIKEIKDCKANLNNAVEKNFWSLDVTTSKNIGEDAIKKAVAKWWKSSGKEAFGGNRKNTKGLMSAANIAFDGATKVGCAIDAGAACLKLGKLYILCKYDKSPAIGEEIYEAGNKACSKCASTGTNPSCSPLGGLCVKSS